MDDQEDVVLQKKQKQKNKNTKKQKNKKEKKKIKGKLVLKNFSCSFIGFYII